MRPPTSHHVPVGWVAEAPLQAVGQCVDFRRGAASKGRPSNGSTTGLRWIRRQRVALARALARNPRILLLDEPFGALDAKVRRELRVALRDIHDRLKLTSIFVTHYQEEAFSLADRVALLNEGDLAQIDIPRELLARPQSQFVREFLQ